MVSRASPFTSCPPHPVGELGRQPCKEDNGLLGSLEQILALSETQPSMISSSSSGPRLLAAICHGDTPALR